MAERPEQVTEKNALSVDVAAIAKDRRFADLDFSNTQKKLPKVQKWLTEAQELGADELLIESDKGTLSSLKQQLTQHLENLLTFETRTTSDNALQEHDMLESRAEDFYNSVYQQLPMRILPFLRQEAIRSTSDVKELDKQRKAAAQAQRDYEGLKEQISKELLDIRSRRSEVEQEQGKFVAIGLGRDFDDQATQYQIEATGWLARRSKWLLALSLVIGANLLMFFGLLLWHSIDYNSMRPEDVFTWQYGVVKITLLLLLSYGIGFSSRNYNISAGLAATNRHRKNVSEVLLSALGSQLTESAKAEMVHMAASEMFKHLPIGYISKEHLSDSGPIHELIKRIPTSPREILS